LPEGETPAGQYFYHTVAALADQSPVVRVMPVNCLASCNTGCAVAISAPGKWTYLLGGLSDDLAQDLLTFAEAYAQAKTGAVMPSKRPASLANIVLGRVPSLVAAPVPATVSA
jgi:predicted metal-binding protein